MSWRATLRFFAALCVLSAAIGVGFALYGAWLVLPFAGLEMLAVGIGLYCCACRTYGWEEIAVRGDEVEVAKGRRSNVRRWRFHRAWARLRLEPPTHRWYASRLKISSHGREVEVGENLHDHERQALAGTLGAVLGRQRFLGEGAGG